MKTDAPVREALFVFVLGALTGAVEPRHWLERLVAASVGAAGGALAGRCLAGLVRRPSGRLGAGLGVVVSAVTVMVAVVLAGIAWRASGPGRYCDTSCMRTVLTATAAGLGFLATCILSLRWRRASTPDA